MRVFGISRNFGWGFGGIPRGSRSRSSQARNGAGGPGGLAAGPARAAGPSLGRQIVIAGLTTGGLNLASDVLTQKITRKSGQPYDPARTARMTTHGLFFYGPYQLFWYAGLERVLPGRSLPAFAAKLTLNQVLLGPVVVSTIFAWNLWLQGRGDEIEGKLRRDFLTTLVDGWKFWVPAAAVNFYLVPVQHRVLYMSACGMLWAGFLSYVSELDNGKNAEKKLKEE